MSAEVIGSGPSVAPDSVLPGGPRRAPAALLEPSLVTRLLAVAVAVFAVPVALELLALAGGVGAPSSPALAGTLPVAALLAVGFGGLLRAAPRVPALRAGRVLCAVLGSEVAVLAATLISRLV